ncbi:TonB-dependent receptor [Dyadobacter arcticus]|uniref:TonB-linked SusC/RagA family outer membrane protein n=1 Tax=Dyadobacter arcticus TaxID=1078754 RepID=A0ABX0UNA7_9BACT|nr:TonB-dependent receptor [Dyadobacter arcticus]NIJ54467.1 TonB-linked SusC/RagA family outer membrane protein [Dyadobacter arcticus]
MILIVGVSYAHTSNAQQYLDKRLSLNAENREIKKVFADIEKSTDVRFVYSSQVIESSRKVSVHQNNTTLAQVLADLLLPLKVEYELVGRKVVLSTSRAESNLIDKGPQPDIIQSVNAIERITTGKVTDEKGLVLAGVNVILKGTQTGSTTDTDGQYSIQVPDENAILVFSFVGYQSQEIAVGDKTSISISLKPEDRALEEIIVVGYGTQKQREVTGSIATIQAAQLEDQPVGQFAQKLQGRVAGVQINQSTGVPGAGIAIRIRGAASINAGNNPLYVVDGFPIVGGINNINPNEIESFSILKGASAAALYGSRAANGVVLITTKQAKPGKTSIQFSATYGVARVPQRGRAKLMNAKEFLADRKAIFEDKIKYEGWTGGIPELYQNPEAYSGPDTDWYEELLQPAGQNSYNLTLLSNKDNFSTATTLGYYKEKGSIINTDFQRFSLRSNNEYKVNKAIKVGINIAPTYQTSNNPDSDNFYSLIYAAVITPSIFSPDDTNPDGSRKLSFTGPGLFTFPNWKRSLEETKNVTNATRLLSSAYAQVEFLKDFRFKSSVSIDIENRKQRIFSPSTVGTIFANAPKLATGSYQTNQYTSWLTENTLNYAKTFGGDHTVEALVGYSAQLFRQENNTLTGTSFPDDAVSWIDAAALKSGSSNATEWSLLSLYSRLNYNFKGKYLLSASIRRDGSSRFGSDNRWGAFPSISAGWIISDEGFAQRWRSVSYLKLRTEFGDAGNFNIGNYSQFGNINSTNYVFGGALVQGRSPSSIGNSLLTWETTRGMDVGLDIGLFKDRISLTLDYYNKSTKNMLYQVDIPNGAGFSNIQDNIGEFHFWGYEAGVTTKNLVGDLKWSTDFNISINRNKVIKLGTNNTPIGGIGEYSSDIWKTEVGNPMGQFYGYVFDGIYMTKSEFDSQPKHSTSQIGTMRMKDLNADGVINSLDRTYIGNPSPKFLFGINNSLTYKSFDLNLVFSGSYGGKMYYSLAEWSETLEGIFNVEKYMKDRWRSEENPGAGIVGRSLSGTTSFPRSNQDRLVLDASYLTLKNVTLGYTFPALTKYVSKARIFISVQQAFILTKYKGANPEASLNGLNGLREGVDVSPYPIPRTVALGVNLSF